MTRTDPPGLEAEFAAVLIRHWRDLSDRGGQPGPALLADLAAIAGHHADSRRPATPPEPAPPAPAKPARGRPPKPAAP